MVRNLPAVKEATEKFGIFSVASRKPFIHPNLGVANGVLVDGKFPTAEVPFFRNTRPLSPRIERQKYIDARDEIGLIGWFDEVRIVETPMDFILTFGGILFLNERTFNSQHLIPVMAHELGHLINGDSYVRVALWFLGQGWIQSSMTPFGIKQETPEELTRRATDTMHDVTFGALRGGWLGAGVAVGAHLFTNVGGGVKSLETQIDEYFHRWDLLADKKAEEGIGAEAFQSYLQEIKRTRDKERFDAPMVVRLEASEDRQLPAYVPPSAPETKTGCALPLWGLIVLILLGGFVGLGTLSGLLMAYAVWQGSLML